jgi:hypothetical protein
VRTDTGTGGAVRGKLSYKSLQEAAGVLHSVNMQGKGAHRAPGFCARVVFSFLIFSGPVAFGDTALHYVLCDEPCLTADKVAGKRNPLRCALGGFSQGNAATNRIFGSWEDWSDGVVGDWSDEPRPQNVLLADGIVKSGIRLSSQNARGAFAKEPRCLPRIGRDRSVP